MIDILLRNGDLVAGRYGDISLCEDESEDIVQTANNNILLRYGNNKFHQELGNKIYARRKKANQSGIEMIRSECINAIHHDYRVKEIKRINVTLLENANCSVDYILVYAKTDTQSDNEVLVEVNGRTYISAFNIEGGE